MPRPGEVLRKPTDEASEGMLGAVVDTLDLLKASVDAQTNYGVSKVDQARSFMAGSGLLTTGIGSSIRATLENPGGSGKNLYVYSFTAFSSAVSTLQLRIQPTTNLPAGVRTPTNKIIGGPAPSALMKADLGAAMTGGTVASTELRLPAGVRVEVDFDQPIRMAPGVMLGIGWSVGVGGDMNVNVSWWEDPV